MSNFAKIYDSPEFGQILVKRDTDPDEHKPEVRFYFQPEGFGVCAVALGFPDTDDGAENAQKCFDNVELEAAEGFIRGAASKLPISLTATGEEG